MFSLLRALPVFVFAMALGPAQSSQLRDFQRKPLVGAAPPELVASNGDWMAGPPVTLAALKGKVVWLQFNF